MSTHSIYNSYKVGKIMYIITLMHIQLYTFIFTHTYTCIHYINYILYTFYSYLLHCQQQQPESLIFLRLPRRRNYDLNIVYTI